ncbi:MAG: GAF domain-containing protein [Sphingomonadales bacterium]|nr:MAG: GAF domain-containing protein [Sphingomonadales bacterium]
MGEPAIFAQRRKLNEAMAALADVVSIEDLVSVLCTAGRAIAASDGVTVIRREGDLVAYIAEDAIKPLWTGKSFAIEACISGIAILENQPVLIPDIYADARVPHAAYRPTFVRSMAMYPIGLVAPTMAVGAYWREAQPLDQGTGALLATLARMASVALSRIGVQDIRLSAG